MRFAMGDLSLLGLDGCSGARPRCPPVGAAALGRRVARSGAVGMESPAHSGD
ncbi:hypothetical protein [Nocardia pseudovaccinii]|uniref:hypothetical protein n=1 Tax=Nocardia pseudovaccinii TaxID=189540 RepID=UPI001FE0A997|nr:hypothetical protein [Nocardia pseudovaccinii]